MIEFFAERFNYAVVIILMMTGLYVVFSSGNLVKKLVGLTVFQTSVFLLYISVGKVAGGQPPILVGDHGESHGADAASHADEAVAAASHGADAAAGATAQAVEHAASSSDVLYSNPLPHVLILTAIVVGVATLAVGLALVVRIREVFGSIEDDDLHRAQFSGERGA